MQTYAHPPARSDGGLARAEGAPALLAGHPERVERRLQTAPASPGLVQLAALDAKLQAGAGASPALIAARAYGAQRLQGTGRMGLANTAPRHAVIQRKVTVAGQDVPSVVGHLHGGDLGELISTEASEAAGWMLGLSKTFAFKDSEELLLHAERVYSMAKLIRSLFAHGLLSRTQLVQKRIDYVGSVDAGREGGLAINVLDMRGGEDDAKYQADQSMTARDHGSISVALERDKDWIKGADEEPTEWRTPEGAPWSDEDERALPHSEAPSLVDAVRKHQKENRALEHNERLLNSLYKPEMTERAQNTVMAIVPKPQDIGAAHKDPIAPLYEHKAPSGHIAPGQGGFTTLLIPGWFEPFYLMLEAQQPRGLEVRFVGDKAVTAYYKAGAHQIPVSVTAPDYASEVAQDLQRFETVATHILTA